MPGNFIHEENEYLLTHLSAILCYCHLEEVAGNVFQGIVYSLMDKKEEADQQFEIYWSLVPEEFPQKGFLDDVALAAQAKSRERLQNTFKAKFTHGK